MPMVHPGFIEYDSCSLYATFTAEEVIAQLSAALEKNISSAEKRKRIIENVQAQLVHVSWGEKMKKISEDLRHAAQTNSESDLAAAVADLEDKIAFLQMLGGLNPEGAAQYGIRPDFQSAFHFLIPLMRKTQFPADSPPFREARQKFFLLCYRTIAELLNANYGHCESPETLTRCLAMVLEQDSRGNLWQLLVPGLRSYYQRFAIESFRAHLAPHHLVPALKAALPMGVDLGEELDQLPNDARKFAVLVQVDGLRPHAETLRGYALKCARRSEDVDVIMSARRTFKDDPELQKQYFHVLSLHLSGWINAVLRKENLKDNEVKSAYAQLQKLTQHVVNREDMFAILRGTEMEQALRAVVKRMSPPPDLRNDSDPMVRDIRAILGVH